jgi:hypothetical protein
VEAGVRTPVRDALVAECRAQNAASRSRDLPMQIARHSPTAGLGSVVPADRPPAQPFGARDQRPRDRALSLSRRKATLRKPSTKPLEAYWRLQHRLNGSRYGCGVASGDNTSHPWKARKYAGSRTVLDD